MTASECFSINLKRVLQSQGLNASSAATKWRIPHKTIEAAVKRLRTSSLDNAEKIANKAGFELWQMLQASFDPGNPPVVRVMSVSEMEFYTRVKESARLLRDN